MGLDESRFGHVVTAIIEAYVLPDLRKAYNKVVREEDCLNSAKIREHQQEAVGFVGRRQGSNSDSRTVAGGLHDDYVSQSSQSGGRVRTCSNCGRTGHDKCTCWQLIGYPEWFTERGGRGTRGSSRGGGRSNGLSRGSGQSNVAYATSANPTTASTPGLTPEQWRTITQIINNNKSNSSDKLSGKDMGDLIIDTGASHHMTGDISLLVNLKDVSPCNVSFADGSTTVSKKLGLLPLSNHISLYNVLYVPGLNCSLISVSKLLKHSNCFAFFTDTICMCFAGPVFEDADWSR